MAGVTLSGNFPVQAGVDTTLMNSEAFVTKIGASGNTLVYSTYLGGSLDDNASALASTDRALRTSEGLLIRSIFR